MRVEFDPKRLQVTTVWRKKCKIGHPKKCDVLNIKKKQGNRLFQAISDFPFASLLSPMLFNHFFVNSTFLMLLLLSLI